MIETESFRNAAIFAALLVLLVTLLGVNISLRRMSKKVYAGDGGDKILNKAIRAHGNAVEHVPFLLIPLLLLGMLDAGATPVLVLGALSLLARCMHAAGRIGGNLIVLTMPAATLTYLLEGGMAAWVLWLVLSR
jgi:uncharacterized protein